MPDLSVIVPARDAAGTLTLTLDGLGEQCFAGTFEVIVVDNGSLDQTGELARSHPAAGRVVARARGEGPGAARNAGASAATGAALAFLDADCRPTPNWLAAGAGALERAELVQGRVLPESDAGAGPFDRTLSVTAAHGLFESANLFVSANLFARLDGFGPGYERIGTAGVLGAPFGEDVAFGWRAVRAGATTSFCSEALAYHDVTRRHASRYIVERLRLALFPALVADVPELRDAFFYRRWFHTRSSALFDLALAGCALAVLNRRPEALLASLPYVAGVSSSARRWGRHAPEVALAELLADGVGAAALAAGSIRSRRLVL